MEVKATAKTLRIQPRRLDPWKRRRRSSCYFEILT